MQCTPFITRLLSGYRVHSVSKLFKQHCSVERHDTRCNGHMQGFIGNMRLCSRLQISSCPHALAPPTAYASCHFTAHNPRKASLAPLAHSRSYPHVACKASLRKVSKSAAAPAVPAPVHSLEAASLTMTSLVSKPTFLLATAIGFSIIAFDVASPTSLHLLPQYLDQPAHVWVKSHLPPAIKSLVAEKLVSDLFITGGIAGWVAAGVAGIARSKSSGIKRLVIALLFYYLGGGSIEHGNDLLHKPGYICAYALCNLLSEKCSNIWPKPMHAFAHAIVHTEHLCCRGPIHCESAKDALPTS